MNSHDSRGIYYARAKSRYKDMGPGDPHLFPGPIVLVHSKGSESPERMDGSVVPRDLVGYGALRRPSEERGVWVRWESRGNRSLE